MKQDAEAFKKDRFFLASILFGFACLFVFLWNQDYYYRQSDQLYYFALSNSFAESFKLRDLTYLEHPLPVSANSGVAFLLAPFARLAYDKAFLILGILYFLFHVATAYPAKKILEAFGCASSEAMLIVTLWFFCFPITMFKVSPVNEGPSIFLSFWFLYFACVAGKKWAALSAAFLAPMFRVHIFLAEAAVLVSGLSRRKMNQAYSGLAALALSVSSVVVYKWIFPYQKISVGNAFSGEYSFREVAGMVFGAVLHLFVPEAFFRSVFGPMAFAVSAAGGLMLLLFVVWAGLSLARTKRFRPTAIFSSVQIFGSLIVLCASLAIIPRYFVWAGFWMIALSVLALAKIVMKYRTTILFAFALSNAVLLGAYAYIGSHDAFSLEARALKALARQTIPRNQPVYLDKGLGLHPRHVYVHFRSPTWWLDLPTYSKKEIDLSGRFSVVTRSPEVVAERFRECQKRRFDETPLSLFEIDCGGVPRKPHEKN